jgi:site-specific DNA-methyltransferase (adenine-specific)
MAVKPNDGTYASNALKWEVSGLNIDGGRIGTRERGQSQGQSQVPNRDSKHLNYYPKELGRFPANLILSCECDEVGGNAHTNSECPCYMLDKQSGVSQTTTKKKGQYDSRSDSGGGQINIRHNDKGGASRFFYQAKPSRRERNMGCEEPEGLKITDKSVYKNANNHPTVKSIALMEYLCTLTKTPTGGIVLDPFAGSGTTCIAAKNTGRNFIGIEQNPHYVKIAEARLRQTEVILRQEVLIV